MYIPDESILKKYADVLIKYALWSGKGVQKGEVVFLQIPESAKPMILPLQQAVIESGAHPLIHYLPEGIARPFLETATQEQIIWQPTDYLLERVKTVDHFVSMISTDNKFELKGVDSTKIMDSQNALKFYMDARHTKENAGKLTWTLALFGTDAMAKEANLSLKQYWEQIIKACFLDLEDPITKWKEVARQIKTTQDSLNKLSIERLHIEGERINLEVKIGKNRRWLGGSGRNIPSFELFITPDWRGTNGTIAFNQPLYRYGNLITDIHLTFKDGLVVSASASENEQLLLDMIKTKDADKLGEFSLTDKRLSRITHFMAETLFDENIGGMYGNMHVALGMGYKDSFIGNPAKVTEKQWIEMGFNDSAVHTDIITTEDRTVTAILADSSKQIIYKDGMFI
ncbi:MAG TPA: aminopeptidase [Candidatus Woesebacteria bacterium]|nr:aminopeptidase [Candidatus Woesebacteria bacterium]